MKAYAKYLPAVLFLEIILIVFLRYGTSQINALELSDVRVVDTELRNAHSEPITSLEKSDGSVIIETEKIKETLTRTPSTYIKVEDSCGPYFGGACVNVRTKPSTSSPIAKQLRNGMVLRTAETVEADGRTWYKIAFDDWLRYPERVYSSWYVATDLVTPFTALSEAANLTEPTATVAKRILVDRSEQMLYAYDGDELFMKEVISTGLDGTPTPRGTFPIFSKTPSRYMQGPLPGISTQSFDLPGVPWTMYFTEAGGAIHGAYWHDKFGKKWSHGCVNLPPEKAELLYNWAPLGTLVTVRD